jgi:signal transduction histidine kinase
MSKRRFHLTLRQRIYLSMLTLILLSFLASGITAYFNFKQQEEEYNLSRLQRKETAVQESMLYFLQQEGGEMATDSVPTLFTDKICELSDVHSLAINLYNLKGDLLISSSPQNLEELGFSQKIDYTIMKQLSTGNSRAELAKDIDYGTFIMAYWYFRDMNGRPIAITNVRYDKREVDRAELNQFLWQLTRIYIGLFLGASLLAYVLSNYITSSLQKVGRRLQGIDLGRKIEPIEWPGNDEIGALVNEYNRMLKEVERSANELARTERESAWREMARQVAHEIKNPLTPMKLRVQHLKRSWRSDDPDFEAKLKRFSASMIEQIDALSNIASEFSDFAKMPHARNEQIDLRDVVNRCMDLFGEQSEVEVKFTDRALGRDLICFTDKDHMIRVLNNLITNAIQAIPDNRNGLVEVILESNDKMHRVSVKDNGTGIPDDMHAKIFQPNFTTKSTGTGLGLAMVKGMLEQAGGKIYFVTTPGEGTVFTVELPAYSGATAEAG